MTHAPTSILDLVIGIDRKIDGVAADIRELNERMVSVGTQLAAADRSLDRLGQRLERIERRLARIETHV
ncbi:hypothetical protein [Methylobacterium nonmethylotrophicum]|uniref:Uncharacterized protein n=1 Tax=Methylobacterium nonmethylotrophicum TaxID=1141884 RepID=A0A4Z0NYB7_9HYPH|nr:hypothetical protein [Methylobacterium nonmethylotrophicum]TGE02476.1 hypothetical protein EU555_01540 [Methylobacterium nonmethylotrophicum]